MAHQAQDDAVQAIVALVAADPMRMEALHAVRSLALPDWLIAAGFVRNLVWGSLYGTQTALNDIDVVYFCTDDCSQVRDRRLEQQLHALAPTLPWSVKNQARMHLRHGEPPYRTTLDAMARWPEKQTAIGVRLGDDGSLHLGHCFDPGLQFNGLITHNPAREVALFRQRVAAKGWLTRWPQLKVCCTMP